MRTSISSDVGTRLINGLLTARSLVAIDSTRSRIELLRGKDAESARAIYRLRAKATAENAYEVLEAIKVFMKAQTMYRVLTHLDIEGLHMERRSSERTDKYLSAAEAQFAKAERLSLAVGVSGCSEGVVRF